MPLVASIALVLGGCKGKTDGGSQQSSAPSASGCGFKSKSGFCFAPPAGNSPVETGNTVVFHRAGQPKPAQELVVVTEKFALDSAILKQKRDFARKGSGGPISVVEDVDLTSGKGFYVATQTSNEILVTAVVPGPGGKMFTCTFNAYTKDKDALKREIQACKSLHAADGA